MVKICVLVVLFSVFYTTFALEGQHAPVLFFKNKQNTTPFDKTIISSTTKVGQREFEQRIYALGETQQVVFCVARDLSPEAFGMRNEENTRAFDNIASYVDIVEYIPNAENPVQNKITNGNDVAHVAVTRTNELNPTPSSSARIIVAKLPEFHDAESNFHYLARIDRACFAISQMEEYKDALFVLTSETNSHLQSHLRKARDTGAAAAEKGIVSRGPNYLVYLTELIERSDNKDTPIDIAASDITGSKIDDSTIEIKIKGNTLSLEFKFNKEFGFWNLEKQTPNASKSQVPQITMPKEFSYSCGSGYFPTADKKGYLLKNFQIQLDFDQEIKKFADSYDCIGFTTAPIWSGLFITFLLLTIVAFGITYIMDIRSMDRFDDPKGKTITVAASE